MTHPILPTLDDSSLESELGESRAWLERRLGRPVELFCYPNGSADARVRLAAERVYEAAVTTEYGHVVGTRNLLRLPRVPVANRLSLMAWRMHRPLA
jgi:peptidoglycan/xylan/chitin deacetylase (PgdA/CDA1 family)